MALVTSIPVAFVAYWAHDVRSVWAAIDSAAESFEPPAGFEVIDTVRQGSAVCIVSCSQGEPAVTILMAPRRPASLIAPRGPTSEACDELGAAMTASVETLDGAPELGRCTWFGHAGSGIAVSGEVARPEEIPRFGPAQVYAERWATVREMPSEPLLAWVEFRAELE